MRIFYFFLLTIFTIFLSCSERENPVKDISDSSSVDSAAQSSNSALKDTFSDNNAPKSDTIPIHIFQKGETLWDLCRKYYSNRHYSSILSIYNGIQDVNRIERGAEIKIPPLSKILMDENFGLVPKLKNETIKILAARQLYIDVEPTIWKLRKEANWKGDQILPDHVVSNLKKAADLIDLTVIQLNKLKENTSTLPNKMSDNLKSVSRNLKHLASGANDGYGYDLDMIHQDLIRAIHNGRAWTKEN